MGVEIRKGTIQEAVQVEVHIPEFEIRYTAEEYAKRFEQGAHLILLAMINGQIAGFIAGYDRYHDGSFYNWVQGVLPAFRGQGIGKALAHALENWAKEEGFTCIRVKTQPRFSTMIYLLEKRGYLLCKTEKGKGKTILHYKKPLG